MTADSPTVVLVHGALTDASVWHRVIIELDRRGVGPVHAPALPMRSLAADCAHLRSVLEPIDGPVLLVGHSYGGSVISDRRALTDAVRALVFVAAFQQDGGETAGELNYRFPGSRLVPATTLLRPAPDGEDLYLRPEEFADVYAHDVDPARAVAMASAQRPIDPRALGEPVEGRATWRVLPSWAVIATADGSIPTEAQRFMAERAGSTVAEVDSSHAVPVAHPGDVADMIGRALARVAGSA